ncbi:MAG: ribbon-helix-helix protein, CopG family [Acidimicrobiia bacterium]|nr:ribbon-helix-helix protein, CopG family [Acidimicrobiia bacterium]
MVYWRVIDMCHSDTKLTHMTKTQVYRRDKELEALRNAADRAGRSVADLVRDAIRQVWLRPGTAGPVAIWSGPLRRTSVGHDSIFDQP